MKLISSFVLYRVTESSFSTCPESVTTPVQDVVPGSYLQALCPCPDCHVSELWLSRRGLGVSQTLQIPIQLHS